LGGWIFENLGKQGIRDENAIEFSSLMPCFFVYGMDKGFLGEIGRYKNSIAFLYLGGYSC
jgi:hypothetical protein